MGNLCSCSGSARETQIEIGEPQNDVARQVRVREEPEVHPGSEGATALGGSGSGIHHQATVSVATRRSWPIGRFRSPEESRAAEEFVARAMRSGNYGRDRI
ncbi:hypothetical protein HOY82DRAFT_631468 [Tuber indicum]|nr:hypothetical protein HOY82DRAFT_631468 [Tuber indicum]